MSRDMRGVSGLVYLLHFDRPYGPGGGENDRGIAKHYLGWTINLAERLNRHKSLTGANLMRYVGNEGIGWTLARVWLDQTQADEERRKKRSGRACMCPMCGIRVPEPVPAALVAELAAKVPWLPVYQPTDRLAA